MNNSSYGVEPAYYPYWYNHPNNSFHRSPAQFQNIAQKYSPEDQG